MVPDFEGWDRAGAGGLKVSTPSMEGYACLLGGAWMEYMCMLYFIASSRMAI